MNINEASQVLADAIRANADYGDVGSIVVQHIYTMMNGIYNYMVSFELVDDSLVCRVQIPQFAASRYYRFNVKSNWEVIPIQVLDSNKYREICGVNGVLHMSNSKLDEGEANEILETLNQNHDRAVWGKLHTYYWEF